MVLKSIKRDLFDLIYNFAGLLSKFEDNLPYASDMPDTVEVKEKVAEAKAKIEAARTLLADAHKLIDEVRIK